MGSVAFERQDDVPNSLVFVMTAVISLISARFLTYLFIFGEWVNISL